MYKFSTQKIQLGISSCLLGQKVRFDGGHKRSHFCSNELSNFVSFVPLCPELAIGLGTPRPSIRLQYKQGDIIAVTSDGQSVGEALAQYGREQGSKLGFLSGYILCAKSPSCGMERVRVYSSSTRDGSYARKEGVGIFAAELMKALPLLPVEEDGRLNDPVLRENFMTRVFAYHDWQCLQHTGLTASGLLAFHRRYKYMLLAHHPKGYRDLGPLLANLSEDLETTAHSYIQGVMQVLRHRVSRRNHTNVLQHLQGYFKKHLKSEQRQELSQVIDGYRQGLLPLLVPITLLQHYIAEFSEDYVAEQLYLNPHPQALRLRYGL